MGCNLTVVKCVQVVTENHIFVQEYLNNLVLYVWMYMLDISVAFVNGQVSKAKKEGPAEGLACRVDGQDHLGEHCVLFWFPQGNWFLLLLSIINPPQCIMILGLCCYFTATLKPLLYSLYVQLYLQD